MISWDAKNYSENWQICSSISWWSLGCSLQNRVKSCPWFLLLNKYKRRIKCSNRRVRSSSGPIASMAVQQWTYTQGTISQSGAILIIWHCLFSCTCMSLHTYARVKNTGCFERMRSLHFCTMQLWRNYTSSPEKNIVPLGKQANISAFYLELIWSEILIVLQLLITIYKSTTVGNSPEDINSWKHLSARSVNKTPPSNIFCSFSTVEVHHT